ncbi:MAG: nuclear transport factor 2 family protein [Thermoleophilaceae bacterium]|nr:nuclear transport factor 2 family protein [Thermoleophilaceae bacterium]
MSGDVEAVVRDAFRALAEGGVEAMLPYVHEEFVMITPPELASEPDTYRGPAGVQRWFDSFYEAMDEVRIEPHELRTYGDDLVGIAFRMVARGRTTSLELIQEACARCEVLEGEIRRITFFATWEELEETL